MAFEFINVLNNQENKPKSKISGSESFTRWLVVRHGEPPSTFTDQQKAFVGPHHWPTILGQKSKPTTMVTLTSHQ